MSHDVFICYASADKGIAEAICRALEANQVACWMAPRNVLVGESYAGAIVKAIHQARLLLLIFSADSNRSPHVARELESAAGKGLPLLPFRIGDALLSESMEYFIKNTQWMDALDPPLEKHLGRLGAAVRQWLSPGGSEANDPDLRSIQVSGRRAVASRQLITPVVSVSYSNDGKGGDGLVYRQTPLIEDQAPPPAKYSPVPWSLIGNRLRAVNEAVAEVTRLAVAGRPVDTRRIDAAAASLSQYVLPKQGFAGMLPVGAHPQLDIVPDAAAAIPWEVLSESYGACNNAACAYCGLPQCAETALPRNCAQCGAALGRAHGHLALTYCLSFLTRGRGSPSPKGNRFLLVASGGALADGSRHFTELVRCLDDRGYAPEVFSRNEATCNRMRTALADPTVAGFYYLGPRAIADAEECLRLADGVLRASEIAHIGPAPQLVFLNTCADPDASGKDAGRPRGGIVHAFSTGGNVVIGPTCLLSTAAAAHGALDFFTHASPGTPLAEALRRARRQSRQRCEAGEADVGWLAYRYLGDPGRGLPEKPKSPIAWGHGEDEGRPIFRVFDDKAQLNLDIFGFAMDDVLLRAAKRRNMYGRAQVSLTDMMLGLIRKGELTRLALRRLGLPPDDFYEVLTSARFKLWESERSFRTGRPDVFEEYSPLNDELLARGFGGRGGGIAETVPASVTPETRDTEAGAPPQEPAGDSQPSKYPEDEAELRKLIARFLVRDEAEFSPSVVEVLINADAHAQRRASRAADAAICERDLLDALLESGAWNEITEYQGIYYGKELPKESDMRRVLGEIEREGQVDLNGYIRLTGLSEPALQIVEIAHHLAQQRGGSQITNRLLLAAFLIDPRGHAAELCGKGGANSKKICAAMMALTPTGPSQSFHLGPQACERVLLPTMNAARKMVAEGAQASEADLFRAFCQQADPEFKTMLRDPVLGLDLDKLVVMASLPPGAEAAAPAGPMSQPVAEHAPHRSGVSGEIADAPLDISSIHLAEFSASAQAIIAGAAQLARQQGWSTIRSPHLFTALLEAGSAPAAQALVHASVSVSDLRRAALDLVPPATEKQPPVFTLSPNTYAMLERAVQTANAERRTHATDVDLLTAFFHDGGGVVGELLHRLGVTVTMPSAIGKGTPDAVH